MLRNLRNNRAQVIVGEYLLLFFLIIGMISRIVRSSTYFARLGHMLTRSLTITENSTGPSLVPQGIPRERILEESEPMRTDCERPWRKAAIHLSRLGCRLQECNLLKRMVWSITSNSFFFQRCSLPALIHRNTLSSVSNTTYRCSIWLRL